MKSHSRLRDSRRARTRRSRTIAPNPSSATVSQSEAWLPPVLQPHPDDFEPALPASGAVSVADVPPAPPRPKVPPVPGLPPVPLAPPLPVAPPLPAAPPLPVAPPLAITPPSLAPPLPVAPPLPIAPPLPADAPYSNAPMSAAVPTGRALPSKSRVGTSVPTALSMAGEPLCRW